MVEDTLILKQMAEHLKPCRICGQVPKIETYTVSYTPRFYIYCPDHRSETIVVSIISLDKAIERWNKEAEEYDNVDTN